MNCIVCGKPPGAEPVILKLTEAEKAAIQVSGPGKAPDEVVYCKPCHGLMTDKTAGASYLKGLSEIGYRATGVPNAEEYAKRIQEMLLQRGSAKPVS
jgi:hypothetical protein